MPLPEILTMLYLHCGWPKTGTTSLQAALAGTREVLAEEEIIYPERWTRRGDSSHRLFDGNTPDDAIRDLDEFLAANAEKGVLISSEVLVLRMIAGGFSDVLVQTIAAARQTMPVRCLWTLRRLDDLVHSMCLQRLMHGLGLPTAQFIEGLNPSHLFAAMSAMDNASDEAAYVQYGARGEHQAEILAALDISGIFAERVLRDLEDAPRLNVGASHKQAVVLLNLEAVSARCGVRLDRRQVRELFASGALRFEDDRRCELLPAEVRRALHAKTLASAREYGIEAYERFFAEARIAPSSTPPGDDLSGLSEDDLGRLAGAAAGLANAT